MTILVALRLFFEFFKIGLFSIGGGLATIPFLYELAEKTGWFAAGALTDMIAISESTPGPIGVNMATYVGFTVGGIPGAIITTLALVTPSIIIIILVSKILERFKENRLVTSSFYALRPASVALVSAAGIEVMMNTLVNTELFKATEKLLDLFNYKSIILAVVIFFAIKKFKGSPIIYLAISAVVGIVFKFAG